MLRQPAWAVGARRTNTSLTGMTSASTCPAARIAPLTEEAPVRIYKSQPLPEITTLACYLALPSPAGSGYCLKGKESPEKEEEEVCESW